MSANLDTAMAALEAAGWLRSTQRRTFEWAAKLMDKAGMLRLPSEGELHHSIDVATPPTPAVRRMGLEEALHRLDLSQFTAATQGQLKWALATVYKIAGRSGLRYFTGGYPLPDDAYFQKTGMSASDAVATAQFVAWWECSGRDAYLHDLNSRTTPAHSTCQTDADAVT